MDERVLADISAGMYKLGEIPTTIIISPGLSEGAAFVVYMSPETITASFWRAAFGGPLKKVVAFFVVDGPWYPATASLVAFRTASRDRVGFF